MDDVNTEISTKKTPPLPTPKCSKDARDEFLVVMRPNVANRTPESRLPKEINDGTESYRSSAGKHGWNRNVNSRRRSREPNRYLFTRHLSPWIQGGIIILKRASFSWRVVNSGSLCALLFIVLLTCLENNLEQ